MDSTDAELLRRYARSRDPEAFSELARRYATLVYGTSLRITRHAGDAEDVTQECFLQLAQEAAGIAQSLPGWLHALARSRALNFVRSRARRRRHEELAAQHLPPMELPEWEAVSAQLDEAISSLPDELREPVVRHYLQGQSQSEVAEALGVSQPSVSRRLQEAVESLRARLERGGVIVGAAALALCLGECARAARPQGLAPGPQAEENEHGYYQGLLLEIGKFRRHQTFAPQQDKRRTCLGRPLEKLRTLSEIPRFSHARLVQTSQSVDVLWFNQRLMPCGMYEVELTTDFQNSLAKFADLQDFHSPMMVVADKVRKAEFGAKIARSVFREIRDRVQFLDFDSLAQLYEQEIQRGKMDVVI